jgi:hypothetical protein
LSHIGDDPGFKVAFLDVGEEGVRVANALLTAQFPNSLKL